MEQEEPDEEDVDEEEDNDQVTEICSFQKKLRWSTIFCILIS